MSGSLIKKTSYNPFLGDGWLTRMFSSSNFRPFYLEDFCYSKMATRGRKQKACFLKQNFGEMLVIHLTGKTTEKRQNTDSSTPPAHT
jgi:hypothetical protein